MNKIIAIIQLVGSAGVSLAAIATLVNLIFISTRPETISVVNTLVGQGVLIVCLLVLARILFRKGLAGLKQGKPATKPRCAGLDSPCARARQEPGRHRSPGHEVDLSINLQSLGIKEYNSALFRVVASANDNLRRHEPLLSASGKLCGHHWQI